MQAYDLYKDISERTQGDVYIGIVGPVRTGSSSYRALKTRTSGPERRTNCLRADPGGPS